VKKEQGDFRVAAELLEMAFAAGLDTGEAHSDAGEIQLRAGRIDEAIASFSKALERRPELIITRVNLSIALAMRGDFPAADAALREAEARGPDHPAVQAQREALRKAGGGQP
jgi:Flp pilus assembly protein TadD